MFAPRTPLLSGLVAAWALLAAACAPALDFDSLTSGSKGDAAEDRTADAPGDDGSRLDAGSDSPGDSLSSADAADTIEEFSANPCANVSTTYNGAYCGKSTENGFCCGAPGTLYTCVGGSISAMKTCSPDCIIDPAGYPDTCDECSTKHDGTWCGSEFSGYDPLLKNVVFTCQSGVDVDTPTPTACSGAQPNCKPNDGGATCTP